ncbi:MAG: thioredoxin domain-containing protein [Candidatus Saccharibacteria bacterium]|nr:thioredoxin domain-containing protein [Candidatus Saccharibacteria bacterium]
MKAGKIIRIVCLVAIIGILGFGIYSANKKTPLSEKVWDERTTVGSMEAENYFIIYTDLVCPYCIAFENAILENEEEFKSYIERNDILVEVKMTDFLYEFGEAQAINSRYSAVATYCAKNEDKFWDYYAHAVKTLWKDFFKDSGKSGFTALNSMGKDFWISLGKDVGLGETFETCVKNNETIEEVVENTGKVAKAIDGGMPSFKFNKYSFSGFDMGWGWEYVEYYFDKGLASK